MANVACTPQRAPAGLAAGDSIAVVPIPAVAVVPMFEAEASQPNVGGWDARYAYALPEGKTGTKRTTSSARRGGLPTCDAAAGIS
jgi:hypothetical protein